MSVTDGDRVAAAVGMSLPRWVIELVAAIERSEDEHPKYLADFAIGGVQPLDQCPESQFLALVPNDIRRALDGAT